MIPSRMGSRVSRKRGHDDLEDNDRGESPSHARLTRPAPRLRSVRHQAVTPRLPSRNHRHRSPAIQELDAESDDHQHERRSLYCEELPRARPLVPNHAKIVNIEEGMDLMSVGEIPQPSDDATSEQQRIMIHYHMLSGQHRVEEPDATTKVDYHRTMDRAFDAERRAGAARARGEEQESLGEAARLRGMGYGSHAPRCQG